MTVAPNTFIYDTNKLILLVPTLLKSQKWFLDRYFTNIQMSDTELVSIDVEIGKRRMSPFCSPLVEGRMVEALRMQTNTFKPPYVKDKRAPDLRRPIRRAIGERIGGGVETPGQREQANLVYEMEDQLDMLDRRMEWMAIRELLTGSVTVAGDGFPTTTIDFGRDAGLTVVLSGGARWGQSGVSPVASINAWGLAGLKAGGVTYSDIIMTPDAFDQFLRDPLVVSSVFYPALSGAGNVLNPGSQIQKGAINKGQWGQYSIWIYNDFYVDDNDVEQPMLPAGTVIMVSDQLMGIRAFGVIMDPDHNYAMLPYAPKTWTTKDPAQRLLMMQSSPLPIPGRPNASFAATVL